MAQAFKVIECVVHIVAVFVVDLAAPSLPAPLAGRILLKSFSRATCAGTCMSFSEWVYALRYALASSAAINPVLEREFGAPSHFGIWRVLTFWSEYLEANRASLQRVRYLHNTQYYIMSQAE